MKKIYKVMVTNASTTGAVIVMIYYIDDEGNKQRYTSPAIITSDPVAEEKAYHADTHEKDAEMQAFIAQAEKTVKTEDGKWAYIYK